MLIDLRSLWEAPQYDPAIVSIAERYQTAALLTVDADINRSGYFRWVSPAGVSPVIGFRYGQPVLGEEPAWVPAAYLQFPSFQAPANPIIPIQTRRLAELHDPDFIHYPHFDTYSFTDQATPAPANPIIQFVQTPWASTVRLPELLQQASLPVLSFTESVPLIIPLLRGQWMAEAVLPLDPRPGYFQFPYFQPPAPANPVPWLLTRRLEELLIEPLPISPVYIKAAPPHQFAISGITRDCAGAPLGGCTVLLFRTSDDVLIGSTVSDVNGLYSFNVSDNTTQYFLVAYFADAPDVAGTTRNDIVGV